MQRRVIRHLSAHVAERVPRDRTRHPADDLLTENDLVAGRCGPDLEPPQPPVRVAPVMQPRDRLLPRVTALRERDVRFLEPGLGGEHRLVELLRPGRSSRLDAQRLELLGAGALAVGLLPRLPRLDAVVLDADPAAWLREMEIPP